MEQKNLQLSEELGKNVPTPSGTSDDEMINEVSVQDENPKQTEEVISGDFQEEATEDETAEPVSIENEPQKEVETLPVESELRDATETASTGDGAQDATVAVSEEAAEPETATEKPSEREEAPKALPDWDFSAFTTEEIITHMKELIENYPINQLRILDSLPQILETQFQKEYNEALTAYTEAGNTEPFNYENDAKERFYSIYRLYREKRAEYYKKAEASKEENLKIKLQIIEELKELIQKEESLNKTFQEFRNLQERWRNTGMVPQANLNDLLETYHLHVENFYSHIKINKELRDLDLKKNLDAKIELCEQAEKLLEENNVGNAFRQLQRLHSQWKEIGPVPSEQKESIWERFRESTNKINDAYHHFLDSLKEEQENNLKIKEDICTKADALAALTYKTSGEWNEATRQILELQEEWKHSGTIPQRDRNKIFKRFRNICDTFFNKKRDFYQKQQDEQEKNLALKIELCEKVEALQESTEWRTTTDKIITFQREWKKIGPAPKRYSNKVWNRFRTACDTFFNNKSAHMKSQGSDQHHNLELKKALIEELRNYVLKENSEENLEALKSFQNRWAEIGFVPIKEKDAIQSEFRNLINEHFDQLDIDEFDKNLERFKSKVNTFDANGNDAKDFKIVQEREKLVNKIKQLEADLHVWENNIGFFSKSSNSEGLIKEFTAKIEAARHKLALLLEKLKVIDSMI